MNAYSPYHARRARRQPSVLLCLAHLAAWALVLASTFTLMAAPVVDTLTGGPAQLYPQTSAGYVDGDTANEAQFNTPYALALDRTGQNLFVADRDNNAIRQLDLVSGQTFTFKTNLISQPVGIAVDPDGNVYVLNRGNGSNGSVLQFDVFGDYVTNRTTLPLTNAEGMAMDRTGNIYVTVSGNTLVRFAPNGAMSNIATIAIPGTYLRGLAVKHDGRIAACDSGRHGIYLINPDTGVVTTNAGFHGAGDFTTQNNVASSSSAMFNQPYGVVETGDGSLVVTDYGNHRVKVVLTSGVVTNLYGVRSTYWVQGSAGDGIFPGWWDGTVAVPDMLGTVEARQPVGVALGFDAKLYVTETYYHLIRVVTAALQPPLPPPPPAPTILSVATNYGEVTLTWSPVPGAVNYYVKRSPSSGGPYTTIATNNGTAYTDTAVINGYTYYYVVSAANAGGEGPYSAEVSATPPLPPVPDPQIGYVEFPPPDFTSVFHAVSSVVFNNDEEIVIVGTNGTQTFYEYANTLVSSSVPNPTSSSASAPVGYEDGLFSVIGLTVASVAPDLTIKAIGQQPGRPNSAIVTAQFQFIVGNPLIVGNNAAQFSVYDITTDAELWYTTDGSDPTNTAPSQLAGTIIGTNGITLGVAFPPGGTNMLFKIRGFKDNYHPSGIVSTLFSTTNFNANKISFGFDSGEASSDFVASAGQFFYAPVTLSVLPETKIYSLQFNVTVTNAGPNPGPAVTPGALGFESFLQKPIPGTQPPAYETIPPLSFSGYQADPPPPEKIVPYNGLPFLDMTFVNTNDNLNLLGVGWLERFGRTNLYNTAAQDLITFSQPHDTLFAKENGKVVLGGYAFQLPNSAEAGHTYQIQIGLPSATSDGVGAPGSAVYIATPTNGALGAGVVNSIKHVTVGQRKYLAGDSAPFRWFNAGDFGNTNLDNADVMQVFQSAIYSANMPPDGSDFFDAMDTCGDTYVVNPSGYLDPAGLYVTNNLAYVNGLFDGNDTNINQVAFGDGVLDVCDVYVTFRRSLDPTLLQFRRFWTNGVRGAEIVGPGVPQSVILPPVASAASVNFSSGDYLASAGQTLQIPVKAKITGTYPIRTLMLNLSVKALDGSPALTVPVQFNANPALGVPSITSSLGNGNYAATWLNDDIAGLTGNATLGTLTVQIPAGAGASAAYAVHFEHASASPNGLASFPKQTQTGLITLSDRSASSWNDGIPDAWRLRYFGSINNMLSAATGDADGDGASNWTEYKAGTDPNDRSSVLRVAAGKASGSEQPFTVRWPSVEGKRYVVERSATLFEGSWTPLSTVDGTGSEMEFQDSGTGGNIHFYRVRVAE